MSQFSKSLDFFKSISDPTTEHAQRFSGSLVSVKGNTAKGIGMLLDVDGYTVICNTVFQDCVYAPVLRDSRFFSSRVVGTDLYNDVGDQDISGFLMREEKLFDSTLKPVIKVGEYVD